MQTKLSSDFELDRYGLHVRLVREEDAAYIVSLRTNSKLNKYIHATSDDVNKQIQWLKEYKQREAEGKEMYFIFSKDNVNIGLARIYNIENGKFTSGSWLANSDVVGAGVLCDIISREIAYDLYPESLNYFDVRKENRQVVRYAMSFHPTLYNEDDMNLYFYSNRKDFEKYKQIYLRMARL